MKKLLLITIALLASTMTAQAQLTPTQMGHTEQNTYCIETVKGRHKGQPVWFVWRTTQCQPRVASPRPGNRPRITVEEYVRRNVRDDNNIVVVYPRKAGSKAQFIDVERNAHAPQKAIAPVSYSLNAEASQAYLEIARQIAILQGQQTALMIGAGIPVSERGRQAQVGRDGIVVFIPPVPSVQTPPKEK